VAKLPERIGRFEVIELIGRGGMGSLYRAVDPMIKRDVAIKLLREGYDDSELRDRFAAEAKSAGSLCHANIVTIYDIGEHNGQPFIAMEYIRGENLAQLIARRAPLTIDDRVRIMADVCAGLSFAHAAQIIHRDVKPANIMLTRDGVVKVLDFGIARLGSGGMTQAGVLMGTLNYMSPEQAAGRTVDARSDVFAVGAVLYELLTFRQAFPGDFSAGVLQRIVHGEPDPILEVAPDLDPELATITERALQKSPDGRFPDLNAMRQRLTRVRSRLDPVRSSVGTLLHDTTAVLTPPHGSLPLPPPSPLPLPPPATPPGSSPARPRLPTNRADLARLRSERIERHLDSAQRALRDNDIDGAMSAAEQVLLLDPDDAQALALVDAIRLKADAAEIERAVAEARLHLDRSELTLATRALERALALSGNHDAALAVKREVEVKRRERARLESARAALERARASFTNRRFDQALRLVNEALGLDPASPAARALTHEIEVALETERIEQRAMAAVTEAKRRFTQGDHDSAIALLTEFSPPHERVAAVLAELRAQRETILRQRREAEEKAAREREVSSLLATARTAVATKRFDDAIAALEKLDRLAPATAGAAELTAQARAGRAALEAARRRSEQVNASLADAAARLAAGEVVGVREAIDAALSLDGKHARALALRTELEKRLAILDSRKRSDDLLAGAGERLNVGDHVGAGDRVRRAREADAGNPAIAAVESRLRTAIADAARAEAAARAQHKRDIEALIASGQEALQREDYDEALRLAARAERISVGEEAVRRFTDIARRQKAAAAARAERSRKIDVAVTEAQRLYDHEEFVRARRSIEQAVALAPDDAVIAELKARIATAIEQQEQEKKDDTEPLDTSTYDTANDESETGRTVLYTPPPTKSSSSGRVTDANAIVTRATAAARAIVHLAEQTWRDVRSSPTRMWAVFGGAAVAAVLLIVVIVVARASVSPVPPSVPGAKSEGPIKTSDENPPPAAVPLVGPPAAPKPFTLTLLGGYPFQVQAGSVQSATSRSHTLTLPSGPTTVKLFNPDYFLNQTRKLDASAGGSATINAPGLGAVTIYSAEETCEITIDRVTVGYPPVVAQRVAAQDHQVELRCRSGRIRNRTITVAQGEVFTVTFGRQ
jgi:serine/threonine protein kinase